MANRFFDIVNDENRKNPNSEIIKPTRATEGSMGYDIYSPCDMVIKPGEIGKIWTDIKAYMQKDEAFIVNVRSSQSGKVMMANTQPWIDSDYYNNKKNDGNIGIFLLNISNEDYIIKSGNRFAQGAFINYLITDDDKPLSDKRTGGHGSTGK